jgi:hypothetical protein
MQRAARILTRGREITPGTGPNERATVAVFGVRAAARLGQTKRREDGTMPGRSNEEILYAYLAALADLEPDWDLIATFRDPAWRAEWVEPITGV